MQDGDAFSIQSLGKHLSACREAFDRESTKFPNLEQVVVVAPSDAGSVPHVKRAWGPEPQTPARYVRSNGFSTRKEWFDVSTNTQHNVIHQAFRFPDIVYGPTSRIYQAGKIWSHWLRRDFGLIRDVNGNVIAGPSPEEQLRCLQRFAILSRHAGEVVSRYRSELALPAWLPKNGERERSKDYWDRRWSLTIAWALRSERERSVGDHVLIVNEDCFLDSVLVLHRLIENLNNSKRHSSPAKPESGTDPIFVSAPQRGIHGPTPNKPLPTMQADIYYECSVLLDAFEAIQEHVYSDPPSCGFSNGALTAFVGYCERLEKLDTGELFHEVGICMNRFQIIGQIAKADKAFIVTEWRKRFPQPGDVSRGLNWYRNWVNTEPDAAKRADDDALPAKQRKLAPSRIKAKAAYEWAISAIPGAEDMTIAELWDAIDCHPSNASECIGPSPATFGKYLRDAGIKKYHTRSNRTGGTVRRRNEI